ncbi:MAG: hypothetical protein ACRCTA_02485, partial [Bacilli bacterium]
MNKITAWIEKYMLPLATKIGGNKTLVAMRDAFATIMPLIITGSFAVLFNNAIFNANSIRGQFLNWGHTVDLTDPTAPVYTVVKGSFQELLNTYVTPIFGSMWWGSLAILSVLFIFAFGYYLSKSKGINGIVGAIFSFGLYFSLIPQVANKAWGFVDWNFLNGTSLLPALLLTLGFTTLFCKIIASKRFNINLGEFIPPAVADGFNALIPAFIVMFLA